MLLEKAWAKIYGSYQRIESGTIAEALSSLTGASTEFVFHKEENDIDKLWNKIMSSDKKDYIMASIINSAYNDVNGPQTNTLGNEKSSDNNMGL